MVALAQKFDYPKSENDLRTVIDKLYAETKRAIENGDLPRFKGLLEIMSAEATILKAIHKIKANKGSSTPGSDGETMRENFLENDYGEIIARIRDGMLNYRPLPVRRVLIPKPGKTEKRPLGIPAIIDRIIQECVRMVIEPILEAQFFRHSYGFRPMRDAHMAIGKLTTTIHRTGHHWIIEGDISKFFDNVNHSILLRKLWHMGIRDRRVLMVIKGMLKAGIMAELKVNPLGTPQGGIISPLLANAYLDTFDQWVTREWENKKLRTSYSDISNQRKAMRKTNLKPAYLIRYADDWVLITDTRSNAEKWKRRIAKFLDTKLKLKLSVEKTLITNVRKKSIHFVGFKQKVVKGNSKKGWVPRIRPNPERLSSKVAEIRRDLKRIKGFRLMDNDNIKESLVNEINNLNSKIRGIIQYYEIATWVNVDLKKPSALLVHASYKALKRFGGKFVPANEVSNLQSVHSTYRQKIPAIEYNGHLVGITALGFCKWRGMVYKIQEETPFTQVGREIYARRTGKKSIASQADELLSLEFSHLIACRMTKSLYNFEYFLNRPYAFRRDKGRCRVCSGELTPENVHIHHVNPQLPMALVNRVVNLASVHSNCHHLIHSNEDYEQLGRKIWGKIKDFREKLEGSTQTG